MSVPLVQLGQLLAPPAPPQRRAADDLPVLTMTSAQGLVRQDAYFKKTIAGRDLSKYKVVRPGQVVVGIHIDEGAIGISREGQTGLVSPAYTLWDIAGSGFVDHSYLDRFLRSPVATQHFVANYRQTAERRGKLTKERFLGLKVPLPPIEEQRRIASILDAADALRTKRRQTLEKLDTLTQSIFIAMFGAGSESPVSPHGALSANEMGWPRRRILEVAQIATGHTPDRKVSSYWDGDISWVNLNEIREFDGRICFGTRARITDAGVMNSSAVVLPQGTVCFSRTASIGFVTIMGTPMATSQDFVNWICGNELNPRYLMDAFLMSREALRASSSGSTHKTIYMRDAERFSVLVPPRQLQDEYADRAEAIQAAETKAEASVTELDALFASLQHRAFRGEL